MGFFIFTLRTQVCYGAVWWSALSWLYNNKGVVHFQIKNFLIIYSLPCHPRCWFLQSQWNQGCCFFLVFFLDKNIPGFFSIYWTSMVANGLKVQILVSLQLQRALCDPSQGVRALSSKKMSFSKKNTNRLTFNAKCSSCTSSTPHIM